MKSVKLVASALIMTGLVFTSCKKDDDKPAASTPVVTTGSGTMNYDGTSVKLSYGNVTNYGLWDSEVAGVFNLDLDILSEGITIVNDTTIVGSGYYIYFEILTSTDGAFTAGTYNLVTGPEEPSNAFEISYADVTTDFNGPNEDYVPFSSLQLTISGTAPNYTLSFNGTLENQKTVSGTFSGKTEFTDATGFLQTDNSFNESAVMLGSKRLK